MKPFSSHIITLNFDENTRELAVIKDLQRHPARPVILHADFQRISEDHNVHMRVPLHFINEEKCLGVKTGGGRILKSLTEIDISCLPKDLPEFIEVDMLEVDVSQSVHLSDISLPEGVKSMALVHGREGDLAVATVQPPRGGGAQEDGEEEDGAEDAEENH